MCTQYTNDKIRAKAWVVSKVMFLEPKQVAALYKIPDEANKLEKNLRTLKDT